MRQLHLFFQGLHDFEELVVVHAIHCIIVLVETGVLGRNHVLELLHDTLPFLSHPVSHLNSFGAVLTEGDGVFNSKTVHSTGLFLPIFVVANF